MLILRTEADLLNLLPLPLSNPTGYSQSSGCKIAKLPGGSIPKLKIKCLHFHFIIFRLKVIPKNAATSIASTGVVDVEPVNSRTSVYYTSLPKHLK